MIAIILGFLVIFAVQGWQLYELQKLRNSSDALVQGMLALLKLNFEVDTDQDPDAPIEYEVTVSE